MVFEPAPPDVAAGCSTTELGEHMPLRRYFRCAVYSVLRQTVVLSNGKHINSNSFNPIPSTSKLECKTEIKVGTNPSSTRQTCSTSGRGARVTKNKKSIFVFEHKLAHILKSSLEADIKVFLYLNFHILLQNSKQ